MITTSQIQELRARTGVSIMDCKHALEEANGDIEEAINVLRKKGALKAQKKAVRATQSGIIDSYIHPNNKVGVLLDLRCETDFVAMNEEFKSLAHEICLHIAAMNPDYISVDDVPQDVLEAEKKIYEEQFAGKPEEMLAKIIEGQMKKFASDNCLLSQPYVKNEDITIEELINNTVAKIGENIKVAAFTRYSIQLAFRSYNIK